MQKSRLLILALALVALVMFPASLFAHDMWASAVDPAAGKPLRLSIGYGHDFPNPEPIPAEELPFFQVKLVGPSGEIPITADSSKNYEWVTNGPVEAGSYVFLSDVKPIFWSQTPDGWAMKPKNEAKGATSCGYFIEGAKGVINVGKPGNPDLVGKPVGMPIEIVPKSNPASVKPGGTLGLTVYLDGKPVSGVKVEGRYAGFDKLVGSPEARAFVSVTDAKGEVNFVPLAAGAWIIKATAERPYADTKACDKTEYGTSLYFTVAK
ncbi:MAG: DUF4198 domain-containing protein [Deltaproteobacteria bacterium]|jgi:uncharacterized GH25 family protein|nr:DUF4198 domain-containing protein [Deltaproteobacteria bacterium]